MSDTSQALKGRCHVVLFTEHFHNNESLETEARLPRVRDGKARAGSSLGDVVTREPCGVGTSSISTGMVDIRTTQTCSHTHRWAQGKLGNDLESVGGISVGMLLVYCTMVLQNVPIGVKRAKHRKTLFVL